jgi:hypothetical protein
MSDQNDLSGSVPPPNAPSAPLPERAAIAARHREVVARVQEAALQDPDPFAASKGVLIADSMALAHLFADRCQERLARAARSPEEADRALGEARLFSRLLNHVGRMDTRSRSLHTSTKPPASP